ncbi:MAG: ABC transporter permease [Clostridiales Family XIII bacterium]|jgi:ribose transport system permease protein|nr:ABC transporter permease [Clostridiales Family XIII bacterium]
MRSKADRLHNVDWSKYIVYIAFVVVFIFFSFWLNDKGFLTSGNLLNITRQTSMITIMAVGMTFVIGAAQIDLSIGSIAALSSLVCALCLSATGNIFLSLGAAILVGVAIGGASGWLVTKFGIPSFLVTLGMMGIVRGSAMWLTDTAAVPISNETFSTIFGVGEVFGKIPVLLIWTAVFIVIGYLLLNKTPFGKKTLATGGNEIAAKFSGININRIKLAALTMSGGLAAFAGVLYAARMQAGRYTFGEGDEMSAIAAVILGGTSLAGGTGSIIGALIGSLLMGMINNGLILGGLSVSQQTIVRGVIIILAVALSNISRKKK